MRLSARTLGRANRGVERFGYERAEQDVGIVHIGIGGFHRAHQAWYTDRAMDAGDRDWAILGVSLRSATVAEQLNPQGGLYTVVERSGSETRLRVVGAVRGVHWVRNDCEQAIAVLAAPSTRLVSFTVTEKGYCRTPDGSLDASLADDSSIFGLLSQALDRRRRAGADGLTMLSCDNLANNGRQLRRLLGEHLERVDPGLAVWADRECTFPNSMVDRIVPAVTSADLDQTEELLGLRDEGAVVTEPFSQWIIENEFVGARPRWEMVGARVVNDVAPYETAKLRMLNGAHSALAYLGLERGYLFVHQAIADPALRLLIERLMRDEAATSFTPASGQNLEAYADALLARFANPALNHRLAQIAMDGSQKIPQRWLPTLVFHRDRGSPCPAILAALAAWLRHLRGDNGKVDDPLATTLQALWERGGAGGLIDGLFGSAGLFADTWIADAPEKAELLKQVRM